MTQEKHTRRAIYLRLEERDMRRDPALTLPSRLRLEMTTVPAKIAYSDLASLVDPTGGRYTSLLQTFHCVIRDK